MHELHSICAGEDAPNLVAIRLIVLLLALALALRGIW